MSKLDATHKIPKPVVRALVDAQLHGSRQARSEAEARIAELEAAVSSALEQLNTIMNIRMPGHAAGALVHAREVLKSAIEART